MNQTKLVEGEIIIKYYDGAMLVSVTTPGGLLGKNKIIITNKRVLFSPEIGKSLHFFYNLADYKSFSMNDSLLLGTSRFYIKSFDKDKNEVGIWTKQPSVFSSNLLSLFPKRWKIAETNDSDFIYETVKKFKTD